MTLPEQFAALPGWMQPVLVPQAHSSGAGDAARYWESQCAAALARLALAREWIGCAHQVGCTQWPNDNGLISRKACDCGRDALLAALEPPR